MLPNACAAACKFAARAPAATRVLNPPSFALRRISARSIGSAFDRPSTFTFGLRRTLSTQATPQTTQAPLVASAAPQLKNLARKFFSSNASLSAPRFFASNATLVADGAAVGEEAAAPAIAPRSVGWWLLASAGLVYAVVVVGGLTRLTESGLSITEWKPITGILPPLSTEAWEEEFAKYKNSPEFTKLNSRMNLEEFKKIFFMEWGHRVLGRLVGLAVIVPYGFFLMRGKLPRPLPGMIGGFIALVGAQGAMGWYMVKSGLHEDLFADGAHPRVSQYRLAAHLGLALVLYAGMFHAGLRVLWDNKFAQFGKFAGMSAERAVAGLKALQSPPIAAFRRNVFILSGMVLLTAVSGAFVAGLDAGLVYNQFPYMGTGLAPPASELFDPAYAKRADGLDMWRNLFENPSTVQLNHRILAMSTYVLACGLHFYSFRPAIRAALPPLASRLCAAMFFIANAQVFLGISTLLYLVPIPVAASHQAGSVALLTTVLALGMSLRAPGAAARLLRQNPLLRKRT